MSKVVEFPNKEQIHEQASVWIARLDRGLNAEEQQALGDWVRQSREHRRVLFEMAALWDRMDNLARLADLFDAPQRAKPPARVYMAMAASVMLTALAFAWSWTYLAGRHQVLEGVYETAIGEHSRVNLPDGSLLVLNTNTRVSVTYDTAYRLFVLERGEINIDVAHDQARPLSVVAGDRVVQAVGTAFNVKMFNEREVELLVTDGKVLVAKRQPDTAAIDAPARLAETAMAVAKGEKVVLGSAQEAVAQVAETDIAAQLSWREGNLIFRGESLEQALTEITRYTSVEFEVMDEHIKQERIAGLFKAGDVDGLLATLTRNFNIESERLNDNKILLRAR